MGHFVTRAPGSESIVFGGYFTAAYHPQKSSTDEH